MSKATIKKRLEGEIAEIDIVLNNLSQRKTKLEEELSWVNSK